MAKSKLSIIVLKFLYFRHLAWHLASILLSCRKWKNVHDIIWGKASSLEGSIHLPVQSLSSLWEKSKGCHLIKVRITEMLWLVPLKVWYQFNTSLVRNFLLWFQLPLSQFKSTATTTTATACLPANLNWTLKLSLGEGDSFGTDSSFEPFVEGSY